MKREDTYEAMEDNVDDIPTPPRKKGRLISKIWNYFTIYQEDESKAVCQLCPSLTFISRGKKQSGKPFYTRSMWKHLQYKHDDAYQAARESTKKEADELASFRANLDEIFSRETQYQPTGSRQQPTTQQHTGRVLWTGFQQIGQLQTGYEQQLYSQQIGQKTTSEQQQYHSQQRPVQSSGLPIIGQQQMFGQEQQQMIDQEQQQMIDQEQQQMIDQEQQMIDQEQQQMIDQEQQQMIDQEQQQQMIDQQQQMIDQQQPTGKLHSSELTMTEQPQSTGKVHDWTTAIIGQQQVETTHHQQQLLNLDDLAITRKIGEMLAMNGLRFSFVESPGFVNLVKHVLPAYKIPSKEHFKNVIVFDLYHEIREKVSRHLSSATWISLTVDVLKQDYDRCISVSGHWLTEDFQKMSAVLHSTVDYHGTHPSESDINIGEVLESWNIPKDAVPILIYNYAESWQVGWPEENPREECFFSCLQAILEECVFPEDNVHFTNFQIRDTIEHFRHPADRFEKLATWQKRMGLPVEKLFWHERVWISTCEMYRQFVRQRKAIEAYFREETKKEFTLDWPLIEHVLFILKPFEEIWRMVTNLSDVIPAVTLLCKCLSEMSVQDQIVGPIKNKLISSLKKMFHDEEDTIEEKEWYVLSTILNPRYKLEFFSTDLVPILIKVLQKHLSTTVKEGNRGLAEAVEGNERDVFSDEDETVSTYDNETDDSIKKKETYVSVEKKDTTFPVEETNIAIEVRETNVLTPRNLWDCYNEIVEQGMFERTDPDFVKEVNEYLNSVVVPRHVCPLTWWRDNQNKFPDLASMARKYLAVPATCLSLQAKHCRVHDQMDYCQMPKTSDKLMFLHYNLSLM